MFPIPPKPQQLTLSELNDFEFHLRNLRLLYHSRREMEFSKRGEQHQGSFLTGGSCTSLKFIWEAGRWWYIPLVPAEAETGGSLSEFEASLVYRASFRTGSQAIEKPCLETGKKKNHLGAASRTSKFTRESGAPPTA